MKFVVATLYHFFDFPHYEEMRPTLLAKLNALYIKGSLLITPEGINGTLAGTREAIDEFLAHLKKHVTKSDFEHKESLCDYQPFSRTKVRLKKETISIGEPVSFDHIGQYVDSEGWNTLLNDPETIVLDSRNEYEVHLGTFERAINPNIRSFKKLPRFIRKNLNEHKNKKIATFCTGGIRCEKLTAWMRDQGFKEVYHLKGGILKYLEEMPKEQSKWQGECYVFDDRIAVGHQLEPSKTANRCEVCDHTLTGEDQKSVHYMQGSYCPHCYTEPTALTAASLSA